jgi:hypothetical protein
MPGGAGRFFQRYEKGIKRRSHKGRDKTFKEEILPVESVTEYFEHFPLLEIDYTFYLLLLERDGKPSQNFNVLRNDRRHMKEEDLLLLRVSQVIIARRLRRGSGFAQNDTYLNTGIFAKPFYESAMGILCPRLNGIIFEQEYHPKNDRFPPAKLAQDLNEFCSIIPQNTRYPIGLRTEAYLADPGFKVLKKHGVGWVFPLSGRWIRANLDEHLAEVLAFEQGDECLRRVLDPGDDRLPPLDLPFGDPLAHVLQELRPPFEMVGNDKSPHRQSLRRHIKY